eukprot:1170013-Rhodomonas_salina.3
MPATYHSLYAHTRQLTVREGTDRGRVDAIPGLTYIMAVSGHARPNAARSVQEKCPHFFPCARLWPGKRPEGFLILSTDFEEPLLGETESVGLTRACFLFIAASPTLTLNCLLYTSPSPRDRG